VQGVQGVQGATAYDNLAALCRIAGMATLVHQHQQQQEQMRVLNLLRHLEPAAISSLASWPPPGPDVHVNALCPGPHTLLPALMREHSADGVSAAAAPSPRDLSQGGVAEAQAKVLRDGKHGQ
jgi:hypothetical protein